MTDTAKFHDMGGRPNDDPIDQGEHVLMDWERRIDSIRGVLGEKGYLGVDEMRRTIEGLTPERYGSLSYYERWTEAVEALLIEKGVVTTDELDATMARQENKSPLPPGEG
jgi:nitrile hydratase